MSVQAYWFPRTPQKRKILHCDLRRCLIDRYNDGIQGGSFTIEVTEREYFAGLADIAPPQTESHVRELITALDKFGAITIELEV